MRRADGFLDADPLLAYLAPPPPWWLRLIAYNRVITTQRGTAPRDWFYLERESGMRVFVPKDVYMFRFEVLEGLMVYLFANVSRKDRTTYREELDRAFGSVTVDPEGARVLFAKPYFEEGLKHGKEKNGKYQGLSPVEIFNRFADMKENLLHIRDLVKQAIQHSVYRVKPSGKVYEGEFEVAADEEELVKYLADDDHQDDLLTLEGKLKGKKLAAV